MDKKDFMKVLHEESLNDWSLDMLKGGNYDSADCRPNSCGCFKAGNLSCGNRNQVKDTIIVAKPDTIKP